MIEKENEAVWKESQRRWNDFTARFLRKCRVPKQLAVFFFVICFIVLYALLNQEVLTVSDELKDLQMQVDITKVFNSYKLVITNPSSSELQPEENKVSLSISEPNGNNNNTNEEDMFRRFANIQQLKREQLRKSQQYATTKNRTITIEGTLSQIIPQRVNDSLYPSTVYSSYTLKYPPFVLPPPFTYETKQKNTLPGISGYYQELASHKKNDCSNEEICVYPSKYVHLYTKWTDKDPVSTNNRDYIVYFQDRYISGQIDVYQNIILPFHFDCSHYSSYESVPSSSSQRVYRMEGNVVYLLIPQGATFFKFIHLILPKLVQLEAFLQDRSLYYLVDLSPQYPFVKELYLRLGIQEEQLIDYRTIKQYGDSIEASHFILTCNTPPLHPYLLQRSQYLLHLPHLEEPWRYSQKSIIYLSRRKGTINTGRRVVNEPELERHLHHFAEENSYQYISFFHSDYHSINEMLDIWSTAMIVIGPHGGAFANIEFAPKGTNVIEFLPNGAIFNSPSFKDHLSTYEQAMALGHRYYAMMSAYTKNDDLIVNIRDLLTTVKKICGKETSLRSFVVCLIVELSNENRCMNNNPYHHSYIDYNNHTPYPFSYTHHIEYNKQSHI